MKKILGLIITIVAITTVFTGCYRVEETTDLKQSKETEQLLTEANNQIGMPEIKEFYEKKMLKEIYELRDNSKLVTYTYTTAMDGKKIFQFKSMGYGLPMSVQYSNPMKYTGVLAEKIVKGDGGLPYDYSYQIMPQPEPNGLFMPEGLSSTWIMRITDDGKREPVYMEETITVSPSKLPRRLCAEWSLPEDY
jgi:hypothetical protein